MQRVTKLVVAVVSTLPLLLGQGCPMPFAGRVEVTDELRAVCSWSDQRMLDTMREIASFRDLGMPADMTHDLIRGDCMPPMICAEPCPYDPAVAANRCEACSAALTNQVYFGNP